MFSGVYVLFGKIDSVWLLVGFVGVKMELFCYN